jgi:hypothetical protein
MGINEHRKHVAIMMLAYGVTNVVADELLVS